MSDWKKDLIQKAIDKDNFIDTITVRVPPAAKYKKKKNEKISYPDLQAGRRLVVRLTERQEVQGYLGCVVLDYEADRGWWSSRTMVIVQIVSVSQDKLKDRVGRLLAFEVFLDGWNPSNIKYSLVCFGKGKEYGLE